MKFGIVKSVSLFSTAVMLLAATGCVKEYKKTYTDFSDVQDRIIIPNSGLSNLNYANILILPDTPDTLVLDVYVGLASVNTLGKDVQVTIDIDDPKRTEYNTANNGKYNAFTADMYKLTSKTITIPAGERFAKTTLEVYKNAIDLTKSWMLPITIKDASGMPLTSNLNTEYFNIIGNKLAGVYASSGTRKNYVGPAAGAPASTVDLSALSPKIGLPVTEQTLSFDYANVGPDFQYLVTFSDDFSEVTSVTPNKTMLDQIQAGSFSLTAPTEWDPVTKTLKIHSTYTNSLGNARVVDEVFVKQ